MSDFWQKNGGQKNVTNPSFSIRLFGSIFRREVNLNFSTAPSHPSELEVLRLLQFLLISISKAERSLQWRAIVFRPYRDS
jgi:hypothetical protein